MLDALSAYAAPSVELELDYEPESRRCLTLQVKQFRSLPVICKQTYQFAKEIILRKGSFYCRPAIAELEGRKKVGRPQAPFKWNKNKGRLQVEVRRLDELNASQKAELRTLIEQILTRL